MANYDRDKACADLEEMGVCDPEEIYDYTSDRGFEEHMRENGLDPSKYQDGGDNSGGDIDPGCFITTACVVSRGLPDNCKELSTLRAYRDSYLLKKNKEEVDEYYRIAPLIVDAISKLAINPKEVWNEIYDNLVLKCVDIIEKKDYEKTYELYKSYVLGLKEKYLKG